MTRADCIPYMCGQDPSNYSARYACSMAGYSGNLTCLEAECAPYCPNQSQAPAVAAAAVAIKIQPKLTAQNVAQPIPAITDALLPSCPTAPPAGLCSLNQAITDHPIIAVGVLVGLFALASGGRRGRR